MVRLGHTSCALDTPGTARTPNANVTSFTSNFIPLSPFLSCVIEANSLPVQVRDNSNAGFAATPVRPAIKSRRPVAALRKSTLIARVPGRGLAAGFGPQQKSAAAQHRGGDLR